MTREIKPEDVPQLMRDGRLEFGMELEFSQSFGGPDGVYVNNFVGFDQWAPDGFSFIVIDMFSGSHELGKFRQARFPLPNLRDGDPVVVGCSENSDHYNRIFKEYDREGNFVVWDDGYSRWTAYMSRPWEYGRLPTKQELFEAGYTEDHINEMMGRWGIKK